MDYESKKIDIGPIVNILWDVDLEYFSAESYRDFLADRIAEKGRIEHLNWYFDHFGFQSFIDRVNASPNVSAQSKNFWELYLRYNQTDEITHRNSQT
jgi:hypothetical protein